MILLLCSSFFNIISVVAVLIELKAEKEINVRLLLSL